MEHQLADPINNTWVVFSLMLRATNRRYTSRWTQRLTMSSIARGTPGKEEAHFLSVTRPRGRLLSTNYFLTPTKLTLLVICGSFSHEGCECDHTHMQCSTLWLWLTDICSFFRPRQGGLTSQIKANPTQVPDHQSHPAGGFYFLPQCITYGCPGMGNLV